MLHNQTVYDPGQCLYFIRQPTFLHRNESNTLLFSPPMSDACVGGRSQVCAFRHVRTKGAAGCYSSPKYGRCKYI